MNKVSTILSILMLSLGITVNGQGDPVKVHLSTDGVPMYEMEEVTISTKPPSKRQKAKFNKKLKKFNKLRYNVIKVWPYANAAAKTLVEINGALETMPEGKERDRYLKEKEKNLFGEYEKDLRNLTISQGKVLVKLIDRQTGDNTYSLIKDLKNGTTAWFWQGVGKIFGYNLKDEFDANGDELAIELVCRSLENGTNLTYYDYIAYEAYYKDQAAKN